MAVLSFNEKQLHVQVIVGVLETYKPDKDVKKVCKKIDKLKKETTEFIQKNWNEAPQHEILEIFKTNEVEKNKWEKYVKTKYVPQISLIKEEIQKINERLCSNYVEVSK